MSEETPEVGQGEVSQETQATSDAQPSNRPKGIEDRISALFDQPAESEKEPADDDSTQEVQSTQEVEETEAVEEKAEDQESEVSESESKFEHIKELAEATGQDYEEFLNSIKVTTKVNGVVSEIPLEEAIRGYQRESDYTQSKMKLSDERKAFETERQTFQLEQEARVTQASVFQQQLESKLIEEYQAIDWNELRASDPAEWSAKQAEFKNREQEILQTRNQIAQEAQRIAQEQQAEMKAKQEQAALSERGKYLEVIPEWKDLKRAEKELTAMDGFMAELGYSQQEREETFDHRHMQVIRMAMLYKQGLSDTDLAKQKVKKVPKLLKPGTKGVVNPNKAVEDLRKRAKKTGSVDDAAMRIKHLLGG